MNGIGTSIEDRQHHQCQKTNHKVPTYFVRPFKESDKSMWGNVISQIKRLCGERHAQEIIILIIINLILTFILLSICHYTKSMALLAYTYLSWFSLLCLVTSLICLLVEGQIATLKFTWGLIRFEALAIFTSVMLGLFGSLFIIKESFERLIQPEKINTGLLSVGATIGLILHLTMATFAYNPPLNHVINASKSSLLQVHFAHICQSICVHLPVLKNLLMPRTNPLTLISFSGFGIIICNHLITQIYDYQRADTIAALVMAALTITTLFPLCICSGKLLLQTVPSHLAAQLDKCIHEALTLDGVLEFRNERFWVLGSSSEKGELKPSLNHSMDTVLAGSLHVRIRRDANEQLVLSHVRERLSTVVPLLTVQVFKDDWTRGWTTLQLLNNSTPSLVLGDSPHADYVNISYNSTFPPVINSHTVSSPNFSMNSTSNSLNINSSNSSSSIVSKSNMFYDRLYDNKNKKLSDVKYPLNDRNESRLSNCSGNAVVDPNESRSPHYVNIDLPVNINEISKKDNNYPL